MIGPNLTINEHIARLDLNEQKEKEKVGLDRQINKIKTINILYIG